MKKILIFTSLLILMTSSTKSQNCSSLPPSATYYDYDGNYSSFVNMVNLLYPASSCSNCMWLDALSPAVLDGGFAYPGNRVVLQFGVTINYADTNSFHLSYTLNNYLYNNYNPDWNSTSGSSKILNKPSIKKTETFSGTSNSSGVYTVTFGTTYSIVPNIQANIINQSNTDQFIRVTSVSTSGFTINVFQRSPVTLLGISLLPGSVTNVNGASIQVLITEN